MTIVLRINWQFQVSSKREKLSRENSHNRGIKAKINIILMAGKQKLVT